MLQPRNNSVTCTASCIVGSGIHKPHCSVQQPASSFHFFCVFNDHSTVITTTSVKGSTTTATSHWNIENELQVLTAADSAAMPLSSKRLHKSMSIGLTTVRIRIREEGETHQQQVPGVHQAAAYTEVTDIISVSWLSACLQ
jgi:ribosomal protein S11